VSAKVLQNHKLKTLIILICVVIIIYASIGEKRELVENLAVPLGMGFDIESESPANYKITMEAFTEDDTAISHITASESPSLGEIRELRSTRLQRQVMYGLERINIIGERQASFGIKNILDLWLVTPVINDRAFVAVCTGKAYDIMKSKFSSITSSSNYIGDLINNSYVYNFFPRKFAVIDILSTVDSEGKTLLIPYVGIKEDAPEISGYGVFNRDKMKIKTNLEEAKFINLMTFDKVNGVITIQKDSRAYANLYCKSIRRVKCYKENNMYKFVIDLRLKGEVISNEIYTDINTNAAAIKQLEKVAEEVVLKECNKYIEKLKSEYQLDVLSLGQIAVSKYGRDTGTDWNHVVSEANIKVNVKVDIVKQGRGDY
jgi:Ger(x)C family germination protein